MNIELDLPKDINCVKLRDFQKYLKIVEDNEEANEEFFNIKLLEIFCNVSYNDIQSVPFGTFDEVIQYMKLLFESKPDLKRRFKLIGVDKASVELGFIPNLDKITMGEYIDLNNYFEDTANLHRAMAVLFRPIHPTYSDRDSYRISSYKGTEEYAEMMKDMPLGIALAAKVFFYRLGMKLSRAILNSSQELLSEEGLELSEEEKKSLIRNMNGIKNFTHLQEETLSKSMRLR